MDQDRHIWRYWARNLQLWGVTNSAALILEIFRPFTVIGAQFIYLFTPFLGGAISGEKLIGLARILEDSDSSRDFVNFLRENIDSERI